MTEQKDFKCTRCHFAFIMITTTGRYPGLCPKCGWAADPDPQQDTAAINKHLADIAVMEAIGSDDDVMPWEVTTR